MKTTMGVKLDNETRDRLKVLGEQKERSPHWLMTRAIREYLDREENCELEKQEDMRRWEQYVDTGEFISHETMKDRLANLAHNARRRSQDAE